MLNLIRGNWIWPCFCGLMLAITSGPGCAAPFTPATPAPARDAERSAAPEDLLTITDQRDDGRFDYFDGLRFDPAIPTPESVLGYRIGEHFTRHSDMVRYLTKLAEHSDRLHFEQYGMSHQRRSLHILTASSPENLERLDQIIARNRELSHRDLPADRERDIIENNPAIAWLSYTVHGNEASTLETAIRMAYTLAAAQNEEVIEILEDTIVVIDPLLNPDGHHRYITWFENTRGVEPIADPNAAEHWEPWPGGRSNHYLFDLNRDWLWQVHPESRSRIEVYRRYLPHLHIDYHEQSYRHPFFLGAGDTPYNLNIPQESKDWIEKYGEANAEIFDAHGLQYSSRERFDYLYPGYGKVTPVYHGAIGMLAEQAGHSRAGLAIEVTDRYTLTLAERAHNHFLLSMSNIETTARHRRGQLERFRRFFTDGMDPDEYDAKAYLIHPHTDPALLSEVWDLCNTHGIEIHALDDDATLRGLHDYRHGEDQGDLHLPAGTWVIPTAQPMGRMVNMLFERESEVEDPDTYDITGWSVPVVFGLDAYYAAHVIDEPMTQITRWAERGGSIEGRGEVALIVDSRQHRFPIAVSLTTEHEIDGRVAGEDFRLEGRDFAAGSLIIHFNRNEREALDAYMDDLLKVRLSGFRASRGLTEEGPVLGANANRFLERPKIAVLHGSPVSSLSYGQIWHLLDIKSPMDYAPLNVDRFGSVDLDRYNVLIVPHAGGLSGALGSGNVDRINRWVRGGGTLVAVGAGATWANRSILDLRGDGTDDDDEDEPDEERPPLSELTWEERRERAVENRIPGAVLRATIDQTHPLAAGMGDWVGFIKRGGRTIPVRDNGSVVARFDEEPRIGGAISERNQRRIGGTPYMTHHRHGRGAVICFTDDPTIRGFQHMPTRLFLNAVTLGPSM